MATVMDPPRSPRLELRASYGFGPGCGGRDQRPATRNAAAGFYHRGGGAANRAAEHCRSTSAPCRGPGALPFGLPAIAPDNQGSAFGFVKPSDGSYTCGGAQTCSAGEQMHDDRSRRRSMVVRVLRPGDPQETEAVNRPAPAVAMGMVWQITRDAWAFKGDGAVESRLPRHIVRVLRPRG